MTTSILTLFTTYLIFPLIGLIMVGVAALVAKKNGLLKNKRLVVYTLLSVLILAVPALAGFLGYHFMPYGYIALAGVYVIVGAYNDRMLPWAFNEDDLKYRARKSFIDT